MHRFRWSAALAVLLLAAPAWAQSAAIESARQLFERYVALGRAFDPAVADLYAEEALIRNRRTYPNGEVRVMTLPAPAYKSLVRQAMPLAEARGDRNRYAELRFVEEGERVRIHASRYSELKQYISPLSLLVGPSADGRWLIYEELSESRP